MNGFFFQVDLVRLHSTIIQMLHAMFNIQIITYLGILTGITVGVCGKGQIISKELLVSSNSPKKQTDKFVFTTTLNLFDRFLGEFEDTKKSFRNCLTFRSNPKVSKYALVYRPNVH